MPDTANRLKEHRDGGRERKQDTNLKRKETLSMIIEGPPIVLLYLTT